MSDAGKAKKEWIDEAFLAVVDEATIWLQAIKIAQTKNTKYSLRTKTFLDLVFASEKIFKRSAVRLHRIIGTR